MFIPPLQIFKIVLISPKNDPFTKRYSTSFYHKVLISKNHTFSPSLFSFSIENIRNMVRTGCSAFVLYNYEFFKILSCHNFSQKLGNHIKLKKNPRPYRSLNNKVVLFRTFWYFSELWVHML